MYVPVLLSLVLVEARGMRAPASGVTVVVSLLHGCWEMNSDPERTWLCVHYGLPRGLLSSSFLFWGGGEWVRQYLAVYSSLALSLQSSCFDFLSAKIYRYTPQYLVIQLFPTWKPSWCLTQNMRLVRWLWWRNSLNTMSKTISFRMWLLPAL